MIVLRKLLVGLTSMDDIGVAIVPKYPRNGDWSFCVHVRWVTLSSMVNDVLVRQSFQ